MFNDDIQVSTTEEKRTKMMMMLTLKATRTEYNRNTTGHRSYCPIFPLQGDDDFDDDFLWQISSNNTQGTAATVLSGLYGAMKVQGLGPEALKDQVHDYHDDDDDDEVDAIRFRT